MMILMMRVKMMIYDGEGCGDESDNGDVDYEYRLLEGRPQRN
jgi:hypothetical protein